ncbi:FAD/NAD(P)-binding oxidoreductase domain-containing protein isoform 2 [Hibiscus syriacus]|uniref:FAD/NAD(P)-binding oxidoreductase domain-containing protein isoform 2 n=1 Tax=Hibiscus syriacus TaxID=106335 RepID=A0A6A3CA15_HIBSY|nr:FAD/NAD(P)-binding oxidoreductase domain-containing protein isoform 2 [Hibiscus syriacus]
MASIHQSGLPLFPGSKYPNSTNTVLTPNNIIVPRCSSIASTSLSVKPPTKSVPGKPEADVVVIGSGISGLCCAGLLASQEVSRPILLHRSWMHWVSQFHAQNDSWMVYIPEGEFLSRIGPTEFYKITTSKYSRVHASDLCSLETCQRNVDYLMTLNSMLVGMQCKNGKNYLLGSISQIQNGIWLQDAILPLSAAAMALPPLSIRGDLGILSTAATRYAPSLLKSFIGMGLQGALGAPKLLRPFSEIMDSLELKDPIIRNWVDLLAFLLAGVKSNEWYKPGCTLEYPLNGSGAVIDALVRGLQNFRGRISLGSHVEKIIVENGKATGVKLKGGQFIRAKKAVVSNAFMVCAMIWEFITLLLMNGNEESDADQNVVLISLPSVLSPNLAPPGKHVLHAYTPGTEPFELWEGLDRRSEEYKKLKAERSEVMWRAVERALGLGFNRDKCEVKLVGTPLTHQRFLRRNRGTFGPAIQAGQGSFPGHPTPIPQLYCCGDSIFPGIGVPAVAASGAIVANSLVSVSQHSQLLDAIGI